MAPATAVFCLFFVVMEQCFSKSIVMRSVFLLCCSQITCQCQLRIRAAWPGCNNGDKTNWSTMHTARKNDGKTNPPSRSAQQTITGYLTLRGQLD
mmetsp:Transcript_14979/g.34278  ORF Transcript_14979/g.34278 Transcript_14979/m.34278 type:complete len:95 (+) Transcript_14979:118-402(+)